MQHEAAIHNRAVRIGHDLDLWSIYKVSTE
jgi:hypothetical protein